MDFASLLVPGAAPAVDTTALLGAPSATPADGDAFADLFAQAMVAGPTDAAASMAPLPGGLPVTLPASTDVLSVPGVPAASEAAVLPDAPAPVPFGAPPAPPAPDSSAPTGETASVEPSLDSKSNPAARSHDPARIGKKGGVPTLPDCPTAPLLPNCPTAPFLPSCPPAPSQPSAPAEDGLAVEGETSEDAFAFGAEDPLPAGGETAVAAPTAVAPVFVPNAPTVNSPSKAPFAVPGHKEGTSAKIAAVGSAGRSSEALPSPETVPTQTALPAALDLGIVPQVTVTALDPEASVPTPPALETPSAAAQAQPALAQPAPAPSAPPSLQPSTAPAPASIAPASVTEAPKDETVTSVKVENVKGREAAPAEKTAPAPAAPEAEKQGETKSNLAGPALEIAVQERKEDGQAPSGEGPKDAHPESAVPGPIENGVRETAATARPEAGADRPAVDRHLVVKQVADRIENMVAARPRDGVTIHMEPRDLGTVTLVVKGLASALDVQVTASDDRVRQSLDASRPELAQALAPRGIGLREIRVEHAPTTAGSPSSTTADSGSGSPQSRSGSGSSQPQPKQNPSAFRSAAPSPNRPRPARATGRGVDLLV